MHFVIFAVVAARGPGIIVIVVLGVRPNFVAAREPFADLARQASIHVRHRQTDLGIDPHQVHDPLRIVLEHLLDLGNIMTMLAASALLEQLRYHLSLMVVVAVRLLLFQLLIPNGAHALEAAVTLFVLRFIIRVQGHRLQLVNQHLELLSAKPGEDVTLLVELLPLFFERLYSVLFHLPIQGVAMVAINVFLHIM